MAWRALQVHQDRILLQVKCQQDGISNSQTLLAEVSTCLIWLQAAKGDQLRLVFCNLHDGVGVLLAQFIPKQTVNTFRWRQRALTVVCGTKRALQVHQDRILLQVKHQQDGVSNSQTLLTEVSTCLVWLQAAEGDQVRLVLCDLHDEVGAHLGQLVLEQTAHTSRWRQRALTVCGIVWDVLRWE